MTYTLTTRTPPSHRRRRRGNASDRKATHRTIGVTMSDAMRFAPEHIAVKLGEMVRLTLRNDGKPLHEFVIGTRNELDEHATLMARFPDMERDEPYMTHMPAGMTGEIVWTFNRASEFHLARLIAGHHSAGMVGRMNVPAK